MGKGETKPSSTTKRPSLGFRRDWQRKRRKCLVLILFAAKRKRPAVVEFTEGRVELGGGVLILLFTQGHLAELRFPPTQSAHSLEMVANSINCSPKHTFLA